MIKNDVDILQTPLSQLKREQPGVKKQSCFGLSCIVCVLVKPTIPIIVKTATTIINDTLLAVRYWR